MKRKTFISTVGAAFAGTMTPPVIHSLRASIPPAGAKNPEAPLPPSWLRGVTRAAYVMLNDSNTDEQWPDRVIDDLAAAGVQLLFTHNHWGRGYYQTGQAADAATRRVADLCHEHGMRFLAYYYIMHEPKELADAHPDWCGVNSKGSKTHNFCTNTAYRDLVRQRIVDLVRKMNVDGIFFDMFHARADECFCADCSAKFRRITGREPPTVENFDDALWREWVEFRYRSVEEAMLDFNLSIKAVKPDAALIVNTFNAWIYHHALKFRNSIRVVENVDGILEETGWYDSVDPSFMAFPVLHNFMSWHLAGLAREKTAFMWSRPVIAGLPIGYTEASARQMCMLTNGSVPTLQVPGRDTMARYMADMAVREPYVRGSRPLRWCGLLVSERTEMWYGRHEPQEMYIKGIYGAFQILMERHLPVVLVTDRDLERGNLDGLKVLLAPNAAALSEKECANLRRFVGDGGGLVASYETGMYDEWGQPLKDFRAGDLLNARKIGAFDNRNEKYWKSIGAHWIVPASHPFVTGDVKAALARREVNAPPESTRATLPFVGRLLKVKALHGQPDGLSMRTAGDPSVAEGEGRYPGLVENTFGKGRVMYFPADLTWSYFRFGAAHLASMLEQAIRAAAGEGPPVEVDAPSIVQAATFTQDRRIIVHLLNDISSLGRSQNTAGESLRERAELIPIHDISVTFRDRRLQRFTLVPDRTNLQSEQGSGGTVVKMPALKMHAMVVAE